ncbi:MAG: hypothetical protein HY237_05800 [Acidobacteria bacterium]|nr:hypothetical protein [Acidobacteriota bacterium]
MPKVKTCPVVVFVLVCLAGVTPCSQQKSQQPAQPAAAPVAAQPPAAPSATQPAPAATQPAAPVGAPLQTQDTNAAGVVAELMECKRKEGVLTIKVRFRNTGTATAAHNIYDRREYGEYYVTAANKKYFILKDSEGTYLATQAGGGGYLLANLSGGQAFQWWAKYPAPPPEVKKIQLIMPRVTPFDDVPITDQ